jgi:hypothetical protein
MYVMAAAQIHAVFLGYYLLEFRKKNTESMLQMFIIYGDMYTSRNFKI